MQRYLVSFSYIGTHFHGLAAQRGLEGNLRFIQSVIEGSLESFIQYPIQICLSSRTDAGVHALRNTFHVDLIRRKKHTGEIVEPFEGHVVKRALNYYLRSDEIAILDVQKVNPDFHARYAAIGRKYLYRMVTKSDYVPLFEKHRAWALKENLDVESMRKASAHLIGRHDFTSFRASGCASKSPVKTLDLIAIEDEGSNFYCREGERMINVRVAGRSFLYNQVRNMVAALVQVGQGRLQPDDIKTILEAKDRSKAPPTAPPQGLFLESVGYAPESLVFDSLRPQEPLAVTEL